MLKTRLFGLFKSFSYAVQLVPLWKVKVVSILLLKSENKLTQQYIFLFLFGILFIFISHSSDKVEFVKKHTIDKLYTIIPSLETTIY